MIPEGYLKSITKSLEKIANWCEKDQEESNKQLQKMLGDLLETLAERYNQILAKRQAEHEQMFHGGQKQ